MPENLIQPGKTRQQYGELKANFSILLKRLTTLKKEIQSLGVPTIRKMCGFIKKFNDSDKRNCIKILDYFIQHPELKLTFDYESLNFSFSSTNRKEYAWKSRRHNTIQGIITKKRKEIFSDDHEEVPEYVISGFGNLIVGYLVNNQLRIANNIQGEYNEETGGSSCMTGLDSIFTAVYDQNDNVDLLVVEYGKYTGRVLLWDTNEGPRVSDRIYVENDLLYYPIIRYCLDNGIRLRRHNAYGEGNEYYDDKFSVNVNWEDMEYAPYFDTFMRTDGPCLGDTATHFQKSTNCSYSLTDTHGQVDFLENCHTCICCEAYINIESGEHYTDPDGDICCEYCYSERFSVCDCCGETTSNDYITPIEGRRYTEFYCEYCTLNYAHYCEDCGEHYHVDNTTETIDTNELVCENCADNLYIDDDGELCRNEPILSED